MQTISYPDSGAFSVKLNRTKRKSKKKHVATSRQSTWETVNRTLKALFTGDVSAIRGDKLINYENLVYIGKMYMGSNMEAIDVNFDTGS